MDPLTQAQITLTNIITQLTSYILTLPPEERSPYLNKLALYNDWATELSGIDPSSLTLSDESAMLTAIQKVGEMTTGSAAADSAISAAADIMAKFKA